MKTNGRSRIMVGALVALSLVCSLWTTQVLAYPTFQFSGTADVASFYQNPALLLDFAAYDVNYAISLSQTATTTYTPSGTGTPYLLTQMAGTISLTGGLDSITDLPAGLNFAGKFNPLLFVAYDPDKLGLSFGIDDGSGTTSELLGVYDFGLGAGYDLLTNFGPFLVPPFNFTTDAFGPISADGLTGFTDSAGNLLDLEILTNDATVSAVSVVPEPSTFLLIGCGLAGLAFWRRRKA